MNRLKTALFLCLMLMEAAVFSENTSFTKSAWETRNSFADSGVMARHTALFLYDGNGTNKDGLVMARQGANLMGHFGFKAVLEPMSAYAAGQADRAGAVFVCGMAYGTVVPTPLLDDLARRDGPTVWFHLHLEQFTGRTNVAARLGFAFEENDDQAHFPTVVYHGVAIPNTDDPEIDRVNILDTNKVQVVATATDEDQSETVPYVLRSGQFWYFAGPGTGYTYESDVSLVLADLLHDILGVDHHEGRRALVRIEDVSANSDPDDLRRVTDILYARHIPFQIALIPFFKDPGNHIDMSLSDQPDVVATLHYMVAHGGTVEMHGITHQLHGVSGDDYEFWDVLTSRPTPDGALNVLGPRVQRGLEECFRAGLYPLAFETPHYAAALEHYRSLATIFSHCYERRMLTDEDNSQQYYPYLTTDIYGQKIIPENLGYVPIEKPDSLPILLAAERLKAVRDPVASFFFHPFMPSKYLEQILDGLQRDYHFISIKDFAPSVAIGDLAVTAESRKMTLSPLRPFLKITTVNQLGEATEEIRPVEPGKPVALDLAPPAGGLVAVQSLTHAPLTPAQPVWYERWHQQLTGRDAGQLPAAAGHAREGLICGPAPAFESTLTAYGLPWRRFDPAKQPSADAFLILPHGTVLDDNAQQRLLKWVEQGGRVVLEGRSPLAEKLGFDFNGDKFTAKYLQDFLMPEVPVRLARPVEVERFTPPPASVVLVQETAADAPLAVAARAGDGLAIYLGLELDPETGLGYTRFPFLVQHLRQRFGIEPPLTADGAEFYFDPGFRDRTSLERLVLSWHAEGIRAVYAAAWHFYPKWTFDYDRLIRLCHQQGIAVYAWLELPEVSEKFWVEHPEWREKTVTGLDAEIGWRKFMNFANPDCRAAALQFVDQLLAGHDWDGVNIAELCFDSADGLKDPAGYIPMNAEVRARFQQQSGFDPQLLFQADSPRQWQNNPAGLAQWNRFRTGLTRDWLAEVLDHVGAKHLDVIVTSLDSLLSPEILQNNGCDSRDVIALMDRHDFTLQVEDPEAMWSESPVRFDRLGAAYRQVVHDPSRLMFDINVVNRRGDGLAPTKLASGTELALTVRSAALAGNGRVGMYSEASILPEDRAMLPFVLGACAGVNWGTNAAVVEAHRPVRFQYATVADPVSWWNVFPHTSYEPWPVPGLDGHTWPCGVKSIALLPGGKHTLTYPAGGAKETIWIKDVTAPFTNLQETAAGFALDYTSPRRAWLTLSREPSAIINDGKPGQEPVAVAGGFDWLVELPAGRHHVEIQKATTASLAVEQAGENASRSIVWLGTRSTGFLACLYLATRLRRLVLRFLPRPEKR